MSKNNKRPFKGSKLDIFPDEYIVFDLETTENIIIEIGAIKIKNDKIIDTFQTLINPQKHISYMSTKINHITDEMVKDAPSFKEIAFDFYKFIKDAILVGQNIDSFDINILYDEFEKNNIKLTNDFVDTLYTAKKILPELKNYKLHENLALYYNISFDDAHRALSDCLLTYEVFKLLKNDSINKNNYNNSYSEPKSKDKNLVFPNIELDKFDINNLDFKNKTFLVTGKTKTKEGKDFENFIKSKSGIIPTVRKERDVIPIDYLFVGYQNPARCNDKINFITTKINIALEQKHNGHDVKIIDLRLLEDFINNEKKYSETDLLLFIEKHIDSAYLKNAKLTTKNNKSNYKSITIISEPTVWRFGDSKEKLFARFCINDKNNYIAFPNVAKPILDEFNLNYFQVKSDTYLRIYINDFFEYPENVVKLIINKLFIRSFNYQAFGCCGKYKICTEKGYCVHEDLIYANAACQYKKIIENSNKENK